MGEEHNTRAHAQYSPSAASRWISCPGSVALSEKVDVKSKVSPAADRGTLMHMVAELALNQQRFSVKKAVGKVSIKNADGKEVFFAESMVEDTEKAIKEARAFMKKFPDAEWSCEVKLEPLPDVPGLWGTIDILGIEMGKRVIVVDFKFGNKKVSADENKQLMTYAILASVPAFTEISSENCEFIGKIIQPVAKTTPGKYSKYTPEMLMNHWDDVIGSMNSEDLNPTDDNCFFCKGKAVCPAYSGKVTEAFDAVSDTLSNEKVQDVAESGTKKCEPAPLLTTLPAPSAVEPDAVQHIMAFKKVFDKWYKEFEHVQESKAIEEGAMPGTKVVKGKAGNRKWIGTKQEIVDTLKWQYGRKEEDIMEMKVKTPTQIAKMLNDQEMLLLERQGWIVQEEGKPKLALEDDKRKDYDVTKLFSPIGE